MKLFKKTGTLPFLIFVCMTGQILNVSADQLKPGIVYESKNTSEKRVIANGFLDSLGEIVVDDFVLINGEKNLIFPYFKSPETALENAKKKYSILLDKVKKDYFLTDLTNDNYIEYQQSLVDLRIKLDMDFSYDYDECILESFFNILENSSTNQKLNEFLSNKTGLDAKTNSVLEDKYADELINLLPYYSTFNEKVISNASSTVDAITPFSTLGSSQKSKAIAYATKHATSRNTPRYQNFTKDCTNFASQILEAAGISQVKSTSVHSGWWQTYNSGAWLALDRYKNSNSWSVADTFARYMGISNRTVINSAQALEAFSATIVAGDFIAGDWERDGKWNHIAFITQKDSYKANYNGKVYYDFKVAQHTTDYHLWASSNSNNWDSIEGSEYAIIRK